MRRENQSTGNEGFIVYKSDKAISLSTSYMGWGYSIELMLYLVLAKRSCLSLHVINKITKFDKLVISLSNLCTCVRAWMWVREYVRAKNTCGRSGKIHIHEYFFLNIYLGFWTIVTDLDIFGLVETHEQRKIGIIQNRRKELTLNYYLYSNRFVMKTKKRDKVYNVIRCGQPKNLAFPKYRSITFHWRFRRLHQFILFQSYVCAAALLLDEREE